MINKFVAPLSHGVGLYKVQKEKKTKGKRKKRTKNKLHIRRESNGVLLIVIGHLYDFAIGEVI